MSELIGLDGRVIKTAAEASAKRPLILIGNPCGDMVHAKFAMCLWGLGRGAKDHRQGVCQGSSSIVAHAREQTVHGAIASSADYLMQIDSDMVFPMNTIDKLLAHGKDIVGCSYVRRGPPFDNLGNMLHPEQDKGKEDGLVEMLHMPTGMLLIKMDVFKALTTPYFRYETDEASGKVRGEDIVFSERCRAAGFSLWCDLTLSKEIGHIYNYVLMPEDPATRDVAEKFKENQKVAANG